MQYPPRRLRSLNGNLLDDQEVGTPIPEVVPSERLRDGSAYDLVHFDLDPQNSKDQYTKISSTRFRPSDVYLDS